MLRGSTLWDATITKGLDCVDGQEVFSGSPRTVFDQLRLSAMRYPSQIAIVDNSKREWTYQELLERVMDFADFLFSYVETKGHPHIGTLLYTNIEFVVTYYACAKIGAVFVPFPTKYRAEEVQKLMMRADLDCLITDISLNTLTGDLDVQRLFVHDDSEYGLREYVASNQNSAIPEVNHDTPLIMMFTSGTTQMSKGVMLSHYNIIHASTVYQRVFELTHHDRTILAVPSYHITGLSAILSLFIHIGGTVICQRYFNTEQFLADASHWKVTFLHGSPTVFKLLYDADMKQQNKHALASLKRIACGGSYTPVQHLNAFHEWLPHVVFHVVYGMTETASPALIFPEDAPTSNVCGASGIPIPGLMVRILDDFGNPVDTGKTGTIWLSGSVVTRGYYKLSTPDLTADGWLNTQDMGWMNEAGVIWVVDRKKDMINRGGEKIWPKDVEEVLNSLDGVIESAVVGKQDPVFGEVPVALIVQDTPYHWTKTTLQDALRNVLATYKIPVEYKFINQLPRTANLKVDKAQIRTMF